MNYWYSIFIIDQINRVEFALMFLNLKVAKDWYSMGSSKYVSNIDFLYFEESW